MHQTTFLLLLPTLILASPRILNTPRQDAGPPWSIKFAVQKTDKTVQDFQYSGSGTSGFCVKVGCGPVASDGCVQTTRGQDGDQVCPSDSTCGSDFTFANAMDPTPGCTVYYGSDCKREVAAKDNWVAQCGWQGTGEACDADDITHPQADGLSFICSGIPDEAASATSAILPSTSGVSATSSLSSSSEALETTSTPAPESAVEPSSEPATSSSSLSTSSAVAASTSSFLVPSPTSTLVTITSTSSTYTPPPPPPPSPPPTATSSLSSSSIPSSTTVITIVTETLVLPVLPTP